MRRLFYPSFLLLSLFGLMLEPVVVLAGHWINPIQLYRDHLDYAKINKFLAAHEDSKSAHKNLQLASQWAIVLSQKPNTNPLFSKHLINSLKTFTSLSQVLDSHRKCSLESYTVILKNVTACKLNLVDLLAWPERPRRRVDTVVFTILREHASACRQILSDQLKRERSKMYLKTQMRMNDITEAVLYWQRTGASFKEFKRSSRNLVHELLNVLIKWTTPESGSSQSPLIPRYNEGSNRYSILNSETVEEIYKKYVLNSCEQYLSSLDEILKVIEIEIKLYTADYALDPLKRPLFAAKQTKELCHILQRDRHKIVREIIDMIKSLLLQ